MIIKIYLKNKIQFSFLFTKLLNHFSRRYINLLFLWGVPGLLKWRHCSKPRSFGARIRNISILKAIFVNLPFEGSSSSFTGSNNYTAICMFNRVLQRNRGLRVKRSMEKGKVKGPLSLANTPGGVKETMWNLETSGTVFKAAIERLINSTNYQGKWTSCWVVNSTKFLHT